MKESQLLRLQVLSFRSQFAAYIASDWCALVCVD